MNDKCNFHFLVSGKMSGPENMALDEALFTLRSQDLSLPSVFRIYTWSSPCITLGYFQKYSDFAARGIPVIRRLTGGLAVSHQSDISYSLVTAEPDWPSIYEQEKTYEIVHAGIKEGLSIAGINSQFYEDAKTSSDLSLCVKTFFPHDLHAGGRKLVGSSQRRRGKVLLQQGSIHIGGKCPFEKAAEALIKGWENIIGSSFQEHMLSSGERSLAQELADNKYSSPSWNEKF